MGGNPAATCGAKFYRKRINISKYSANIGKYQKPYSKYRHHKNVAEASSFCHLWSQVFSGSGSIFQNIGKYHKAKMKYRHCKDVAEHSTVAATCGAKFSGCNYFQEIIFENQISGIIQQILALQRWGLVFPEAKKR